MSDTPTPPRPPEPTLSLEQLPYELIGKVPPEYRETMRALLSTCKALYQERAQWEKLRSIIEASESRRIEERDKAESELSSARARIEELEQDAKRLDWLEANSDMIDYWPQGATSWVSFHSEASRDANEPDQAHGTMRDAIDAAMDAAAASSASPEPQSRCPSCHAEDNSAWLGLCSDLWHRAASPTPENGK